MTKRKRKERTEKRKALKAWSIAVRARDNNRCNVCGKPDYLNAHHLIPKERFPQYALDVDNGICLCPGCHKFGSYSFHRHPLWAAVWLQKNRPDLYDKALPRLAA